MAATNATARRVDAEAAERPSVDQAGMDALMREFYRKASESGADGGTSTDAAKVGPAPLRRDFDMSADLLDRAAQAFDLLISRCQTLEGEIENAQRESEQARARAAEQVEAIEGWKRLASGLKAQVEAAERDASQAKARCEAAEQKVAALERVSAQVAGRATAAEQLSTRLHDKVVSAFGIGSRAHPVLEAVATKSATA